jgi:pilus assembly protein CpaD
MLNYLSKLTASRTKVAILLIASTSLAACSADELAADDQYVPANHYEQYPINVAKAPIKLEISSSQGKLQPSQINAISGFARSAKNAVASKISIKRPSSGGASRQVATQTYRLLMQAGISASQIVQSTYPGPAKGPVQISYVRKVAITKECGDWSTNVADTSGNQSMPNFGCAVQNNIAAQVVNPEDFVVPEATTPALAESRIAAANASGSGAGSSASGSSSLTIP